VSVRARLADPIRDSGDIEAEAAVLVADGKVYAGATPEDAFEQWLALTKWLIEKMQPSALWQALIIAQRHAEVARGDHGRARAGAPIMTPTTVLEVAKAKLGADVYAKLRAACVDWLRGVD